MTKNITPAATKAQMWDHILHQDAQLRAQGLALEALRLEHSITTVDKARLERMAITLAAPHRALPGHFVAAREAAMRMGRSVKVEVQS